jgi:hypothetical protein
LERLRADPRTPWGLLALMMFASLAYCLWAAEGVYFTDDELYWLGSSPNTTLERAFDPHSGHLIAVSRLLYRGIFETLGSGYLPFRLLSLGAVFLAVGLLFAWSRKRVGDYVALAPCLVLLFFGSDSRHLILGNGFTVVFAIACGLAALLALEHRSRRGDIVACAALCLGVLTYTTALPFVVGAAIAILLGSDRWRRIWVPLLPVLIYGAWRIWLRLSDAVVWRGDTDPANLLLLPSWTYQSLSAVMNALTGLAYDFSGAELPAADAAAGPALALLVLVAVGWRIRGGRPSSWLWVALATALALFASQVLAWIPDAREPGEARYLYPGAFVVLLVLFETMRDKSVGKTGLIAIWIVAFSGFATNATMVHDQGQGFAVRGEFVRAETTAAKLLHQSTAFVPGASAVPGPERYIEPAVDLLGDAEDSYGIGLSEGELAGQSPEIRTLVDTLLGEGIGVGLAQSTGSPGDPGCEWFAAEGKEAVVTLPPGGASLFSRTGGEVSLGRFGDRFEVSVGELEPRRKMQVFLPVDPYSRPWQASVGAPRVAVCPVPA